MATRRLIRLIGLCAALAGMSVAAERQLKRSDLPIAVEKTLAEQSQGATVRSLALEQDGGATSYEAELIVEGHRKDVLIESSGVVAEIEEEVVLEKLPAAVQQALAVRAGKGRITKVESLTKAGKLVAYEAVVTTGGKHSEIQVGPGGERLAHPQ